MRADSYSTAFMVDQSPMDVFAAVNNVRGRWMGDITGESQKLGDTFTYCYETMHRSTQKVTEFVPGKKVVWHVVDAELNFVDDKTEWTGSDIVFEITRRVTRPSSASLMSGCSRTSSASMTARTPGAPISTGACAN